MRILSIAVLLCLAVTPVYADDLLEITLRNHDEASFIQGTGATVAFVDRNVYLVLAAPGTRTTIDQSGISYREILRDTDRNFLAVDRRPIDLKTSDHTTIYERNGIRILVTERNLALAAPDPDLLPLGQRRIVVRYLPPRPPLAAAAELPASFDTLISLVNEDSLRTYTERLQAFYRRVAGSDSSRAARDWIAAKFQSFGYDSVVIDSFTDSQHRTCSNVIACLPGASNPEQQIVIGGHFDAVSTSPGADDNATGTVGTMEMARVLAGANLPMTVVFIAFDAEESGLWGSQHYADSVAARGADIVLMINLDMIAYLNNSDSANLYVGPEDAYARLWKQLSPTYGISRSRVSGSGASDHASFANNGYDVIFVQEGTFSAQYHHTNDSTTYLNFEYMTRLVKASLHTALATAVVPPPVYITSVREPGDGHSQLIRWRNLSWNTIDHVRVTWYPAASPSAKQSVDLPASDTSYTVTGLTDNVPYVFYVQAFDSQQQTSYAIKEAYGTPRSKPDPPEGFVALPIYHGIRVTWNRNNVELDLDHYSIIRDGSLIAATADTTYNDLDPALGTAMHRYFVRATDKDNNSSDTVGIVPPETRAATLEPNRVLAVNRSSTAGGIYVKETETGVFLRDALAPFNFDYVSDTAALSHPGEGITLVDMLSHGVLVVGDESGRGMDISKEPVAGGILDSLAYYCSIGGKLIIFGRFGNITTGDTIDYSGGSVYDDDFGTTFHIGERIQTPTAMMAPNYLTGDLVGADPLVSGYPVLSWDSVLTAAHSTPLVAPSGIPCASFVQLNDAAAHPLYAYHSRYDTSGYNGGTIAWYYFGFDYKYIFFDIPLSFCDRSAAIATLRKAVQEIMSQPTDVNEDPDQLPDHFVLAQNYPNPFNATTTIAYDLPNSTPVRLTIYNLLGQIVTSWRFEKQTAGRHTVLWRGTNQTGQPVATGIYFYRLEAGDHVATKKMLLLK